MLVDLDPVVEKAAVIRVCRESDFFPSVAQIVTARKNWTPEMKNSYDYSFQPLPSALPHALRVDAGKHKEQQEME